MTQIMLIIIFAALGYTDKYREASISHLTVSKAQQSAGSIVGGIFDPGGRALPGVTVTAVRGGTTSSGPNIYTTVSDNDGRFVFESVPTGSYEIVLAFDDVWLMKDNRLRVAVKSMESATVEFRLEFIEPCQVTSERIQGLTNEDKSQIVNWLIQNVILKERGTGQTPIVDEENIEKAWGIERGENPILLSGLEIQAKANQEGDYMYWRLGKFRIKGQCAAVDLEKRWADGESSLESGKRTLLGEKVLKYIFRNTEGRWLGTLITGWIT